MKPSRAFRWFMVIGLLVGAVGCGVPGGGPLGSPAASPLMKPFEGVWTVDFEKTLGAQRAGGALEESIAATRKFHTEHPELWTMQGSLRFSGNTAVGEGMLQQEYWCFGLHEHDGWVCGKAWHHEDRHDPGDMSKCCVRFRLDGNDLHFDLRMQDGLPDLNDPDLLTTPAPEGGSATTCDAEKPAGQDWGEWSRTVYVRKP